MYLKGAGFALKKLRLDILALLLIPLGLAAFAYFCNMRFHDPLAFVARQSRWRQGGSSPWAAFQILFDAGPSLRGIRNNWSDLVIAVLALTGLPLVFRRLGTAYGLYASAMTLVPLCSGLMSFQRLILASFPHFLLLGTLGRSQLAFRTINLVFIVGMTLNFAIFSLWGWIG